MIFNCPACQGENNLPISSVPPGGLRTTCRHCQQSLHLNENGQLTLLGGAAAGYASHTPRPNAALADLELELPQEDPFAQDLSADQELIDPYGNLDHLGLPDISGIPSAPPPLDDPFGGFSPQPNAYAPSAQAGYTGYNAPTPQGRSTPPPLTMIPSPTSTANSINSTNNTPHPPKKCAITCAVARAAHSGLSPSHKSATCSNTANSKETNNSPTMASFGAPCPIGPNSKTSKPPHLPNNGK